MTSDAGPGRFALVAHPSTRSSAIRGLDVQVSGAGSGSLLLRYALRADMRRIRVGQETTPSRGDRLWKQTCFEVLVRFGETDGYYEFNFSPTRQWAVYRFDSYRRGMSPLTVESSPCIAVRRRADHLQLEATFRLPDGGGGAPRLALAAVVEEDGGRLCYWAVRHPPGKPDFHRAEAFAVDLPPRR